MESAVLSIVQNGVSMQGLVLLAQLVIAAFLLLAVKSWVQKTWAWHQFAKSTVISKGSVVVVTLNGAVTMHGTIVSADKNRIVVQDGHKKAYVRTQDFVRQAWVVCGNPSELRPGLSFDHEGTGHKLKD